jgi:putative transposase
MDVWSRRIVGWRVADREAADMAAALVTQICSDGKIDTRGLALHSDNGTRLGVIPSFSRPHVSDDNPYSEALFRTLKHTPACPRLRFADLASAQRWVARFVASYNGKHRHSGIRYLTPDERGRGAEHEVVARRHELYERTRSANPERWTRATRDWSPVQLRAAHAWRRPSSPAGTVSASCSRAPSLRRRACSGSG